MSRQTQALSNQTTPKYFDKAHLRPASGYSGSLPPRPVSAWSYYPAAGRPTRIPCPRRPRRVLRPRRSGSSSLATSLPWTASPSAAAARGTIPFAATQARWASLRCCASSFPMSYSAKDRRMACGYMDELLGYRYTACAPCACDSILNQGNLQSPTH